LQDAQGDIDGKKIEVKALAARIAARAAQNGSMADPREAKLRAEIKKVHDMRSNMLRQEPAARRKIPELQERLDQVKRAAAAAEGRREEVAGKLETARRQHANLSQQSSDPMAAYGTRMDIVLREINRARWREKPLGPLGQYVQLVDSRYKDIVHSLLGTAMVGFAVRYREDKDQLIRILKNALNQYV
jgi:chromosome segregation ATPase